MGLVTLANMKTYLGVSGSTYDTFLQQQIDLVSQAIEAYCRRVFTETDWVQTFYRDDYRDGTPFKFETFHFPVSEVTSLDVDDEDYTTYRVHKPTGIIRPDRGFYWADSIEISYTAGYAVIPAPIQDVVYSVVSQRYNRKLAGVALDFGDDVQSVTIPGAITITFDYTLQNNDRSTAFGQILGSYLNQLDYYRSERAIIGSGTIEFVEEDV